MYFSILDHLYSVGEDNGKPALIKAVQCKPPWKGTKPPGCTRGKKGDGGQSQSAVAAPAEEKPKKQRSRKPKAEAAKPEVKPRIEDQVKPKRGRRKVEVAPPPDSAPPKVEKRTRQKKVKPEQVGEVKPKRSRKSKVEHKPFMSEKDAIAYTKDSVWKDKVFYHGTSAGGANSITKDGIDMSKNLTAVFGQGFYMGGGEFGRSIAANYADEASDKTGDDPAVLEMRVNVKNPLSIKTAEALQQIYEAKQSGKISPPKFNKDGSNMEQEMARFNRDIANVFRQKGYDGIHITDSDFFIAFDPKQVAIYGKHNG